MTVSQQMRALAIGNELRMARVRLQHDLHDGRDTIERVVTDSPEIVCGLPAADVIRYGKGIGPVTFSRLGEFGIAERINLCRRLGSLSERQRKLLADWLAIEVGRGGRPRRNA